MCDALLHASADEAAARLEELKRKLEESMTAAHAPESTGHAVCQPMQDDTAEEEDLERILRRVEIATMVCRTLFSFHIDMLTWSTTFATKRTFCIN